MFTLNFVGLGLLQTCRHLFGKADNEELMQGSDLDRRSKPLIWKLLKVSRLGAYSQHGGRTAPFSLILRIGSIYSFLSKVA